MFRRNRDEECWAAILAGKGGIGPITQFDAARFSCRIAGEVKNFDPLKYVEKKDVKKMGRFIQFAMAASEFAAQAANLEPHPSDAETFGVYIGSGIGGFEVIEREHQILLERGPSRLSPFFIPSCIVNLGQRLCVHQVRRKGSKFRDRDSLHDQRPFSWRFNASDSAWVCGRDDLRRERGMRDAHGYRRICRYARALDEK